MIRKKKYLMTGASGFIGSCLLRELLAKGNNVHILLRKEANLWRIKELLGKAKIHINDLSDADELSKLTHKIKPDIIYHLAAYGAYSSQSDPDLCIKTNILGTWNLLKATSDVDYELFVNTGSSSEYGFKKKAMNENDNLEPASDYAVTKSSQTLLCSYFARKNKKPIVTLRPFSIYGPYEDKNRFIPTLLKTLYSGQQMNLVASHISRDWLYVDDMVRAYLLIHKLKKQGGEVFNIGSARQYTIDDVVKLAVKVTGRTTDFRRGKMKNRIWDTSFWVADNTKAKKQLGWNPRFTLEQGLLKAWTWFKKNAELYS